ncbi:MAG: hypothetical protein AAGA66_11215 [Bacteroidota bacterium]
MSVILVIRAPELFTMPSETILPFLTAIFLLTCFIPALSIYSLRFLSSISDLEITDRKERPLPFSIITIWYAASSYLFIVKLALGRPFSTILLSVTLLIALLFLITYRFKISIHATAIWSAVGILASLIMVRDVLAMDILYLSFILAGLTCTSRLYLGYHLPKEVWSGSLLGFIFGFYAVYFFG